MIIHYESQADFWHAAYCLTAFPFGTITAEFPTQKRLAMAAYACTLVVSGSLVMRVTRGVGGHDLTTRWGDDLRNMEGVRVPAASHWELMDLAPFARHVHQESANSRVTETVITPTDDLVQAISMAMRRMRVRAESMQTDKPFHPDLRTALFGAPTCDEVRLAQLVRDGDAAVAVMHDVSPPVLLTSVDLAGT